MNADIRAPVSTVAELASLDEKEMLDGYRDGFDGDPEPGDNRSKSYWHGWRNGAADARRIPIDGAMISLVKEVLRK